MSSKHRKRRQRRGYPVALLLGLEEKRAVTWNVYSESIKPLVTLRMGPGGSKGTSNPGFRFFEDIITRLKQSFSTGVKTLVIASFKERGKGSNVADDFMAHLKKHHGYLFKGKDGALQVSMVQGNAIDVESALALAKGDAFQAITTGTVSREATNIVEYLDATINNPNTDVELYYTLDENERLLQELKEDEGSIPDYVLMTDEYYNKHKSDPTFQRVLALVKRTRTRSRVIQSVTEAGERIAQLGGLACIASPPDAVTEEQDLKRIARKRE